MIGALIGAGCVLFLATIAAALAAGKMLQEIKDLRKDVEEIPGRMRKEVKLLVLEEIEIQLGKYVLEKKEITGVRAIPTEMQG